MASSGSEAEGIPPPAGVWGEDTLHMLTRLLLLASLPLLLLDVGKGSSKGLLLACACCVVAVADEEGGAGRAERLVRGPELVVGTGRLMAEFRGVEVNSGGRDGEALEDVEFLRSPSCGKGVSSLARDSRNMLSAAIQLGGRSCKSFLAACEYTSGAPTIAS